ncbi:hypothetical protein J1605_017412 [Eschrichtius robustus]|uniref:Dynein light chain Tctex-type 1 n=1 Tax=Eschrichtius robustus TaxID=9764 RepID=A0AB34I100_ESCRO|nr:hypothetical protein J1605_017412 [Eschrichtius robustus]
MAVPAAGCTVLKEDSTEKENSKIMTAFVVDEVSNIVKEAIESAIGGNAYQHSKVNQWTTNVVEQTLSQLTKLGKPFKYIGSCTVRWENKTMYCIVSAFGLSI